jgi:uncharacterized protein
MSTTTILWQRLDEPGHDAARLSPESFGWRIGGTAVFASDGRPCCLDYVVLCDEDWIARSATVHGWVGDQSIDIALTVDAARTWRMNGIECPDVRGCIDVDLHFTPATNTLPIRRLGLDVGAEAEIHVAWLVWPELSVQRVPQRYTRLAKDRYRYTQDNFEAELTVDEQGLVLEYEGLWRAIATA